MSIVESESETYFYQGRTILAAAVWLSVNDFKKCIQVLMRSQELYLAFYVAKFFYRPALKEVATKLAERAEKYFQKDLCLKLLVEHAQDERLYEMVKSRTVRNRRSAEQIQKDDAYF